MPWTKEQEQAYTEDIKNIIVSAGAGSGKTAVLKERVGKLIEDEKIDDIDELLVLTFTKAAATEMKNRIKKKIKTSGKLKKDNKRWKSLLNKIDNCQITTFDAFCLYIVQKYHTELEVKKDVQIIDEGMLSLKKNEYIRKLLNKLYDEKNETLREIIDNFTDYKNDQVIIDWVNIIDEFFDKSYEKQENINNYVNKFYTEEKFNNLFAEYEKYIKSEVKYVSKQYDKLSDNIFEDSKDFDKRYNDEAKAFVNSNDYGEIQANSKYKVVALPSGRGASNKYVDTDANIRAKEINSEISKTVKKVKYETFYTKEQWHNKFFESKPLVELLMGIVKQMNKEIEAYKSEKDLYTFSDISRKAIYVIENNSNIQKELREKYKEILIDEFQDTNDIQEKLITLIANDNVYVVGDVKQSIYGFRNANPDIFQKKYKDYEESKDVKKLKIDLLKNFRSREEIVDMINMIFTPIMDLEIGGEDYASHKMEYGNVNYKSEELATGEDYRPEIYYYDAKLLKKDKNNPAMPNKSEYSKNEVEAFIIAQDIQNRMKNGFKVIHTGQDNGKEVLKTESVNYSDFCILMQDSSQFYLYKKIFTYFGIPLNVEKNEKITDSDIFTVICSLFRLIDDGKSNQFSDLQTKKDYLSVARSFIVRQDDNITFDIVKNGKLKDDGVIISKIKEISKGVEAKSITEIMDELIEKFAIFDNLMYIGDVDENIVKINYLYQVAEQFNDIGRSYKDFFQYFDDIVKEDKKVEYSAENDTDDAVKMMTIHKSKGLQFKICYYPLLHKKFNTDEQKEKVTCSEEYGISLPFFDKEYGVSSMFNKTLFKNNAVKKDIAEKIRLFYVALTRVEEKMILVYPMEPKECLDCSDQEKVISSQIRTEWKTFADMLNAIPQIQKDPCNKMKKYYKVKHIDLMNEDDIVLTKDYINKKDELFSKISKIKGVQESITYQELDPVCSKIIDESHYSKSTNKVITETQRNNMDEGTKLHSYLEEIDFVNPNYSVIDENDKKLIKNFINSDIMKDVANAKIYKEQEFITVEEGQEKHGIIDLLLEYEDKYVIIDYKTKNIDDEKYDEQVNGYRRYVKNFSGDKPIECYLYSIMTSEYRKVEEQ